VGHPCFDDIEDGDEFETPVFQKQKSDPFKQLHKKHFLTSCQVLSIMDAFTFMKHDTSLKDDSRRLWEVDGEYDPHRYSCSYSLVLDMYDVA
jgi:hypothetical protein